MSKHYTNKVYCKPFGNLPQSLEHHLRRPPSEPWHTLPLEQIGILVWFQVGTRVDKRVEPQGALGPQHHVLALVELELADLVTAEPGLVVPFPLVLAALVLAVLVVAELDTLLLILVHISQQGHPHRL